MAAAALPRRAPGSRGTPAALAAPGHHAKCGGPAEWAQTLRSLRERRMRIGAGLDGRLGLGFDDLRQAGREAARLGFESLWTPSGGVPDAFHVCASWSLDSPVRTGISVVPVARMWTPLALATQAATVGQISDGRFVLGIGTG